MTETCNEALVKLLKDNSDSRLNYEKLYFQNKGFIYLTVKKYVNEKNTLDDLMQQAFIGLVKAVECYDETRSDNFLNILKYCIMNSIRELETEIPAHLKSKIIKYKRTLKNFYNLNGKNPTEIQIMKDMNISQVQLTYIKQLSKAYVSLDEVINLERETTRLDSLIDKNSVNIEELIEKKELKRIVHESINLLPSISREVINKRYFEDKSFKIIGEEMNIAYDHVKRLQDKALQKLRRNKKLNEIFTDYSEINEYLNVGITEFNRTWTSSTERIVLKREELRKGRCN